MLHAMPYRALPCMCWRLNGGGEVGIHLLVNTTRQSHHPILIWTIALPLSLTPYLHNLRRFIFIVIKDKIQVSIHSSMVGFTMDTFLVFLSCTSVVSFLFSSFSSV